MRTIKFRAWDNKNKQWLLGYNYPNLGGFSLFGECMMFGEWNKVVDKFLFERDGLTFDDLKVMQFTGLLDKNGKEIYADDIISDGEWKQRVYATEGGFAVKSLFWSVDFRDLKLGDDLILEPLSDPQIISYIKQNCEVIGNIYE